MKDKLINLSKQILDKVSFNVISPLDKIPFGFKKHTRSISWLAEQVVVQHLKFNREKYNIDVIEESDSDLNVWDFRMRFKNGQVISNAPLIYVNFKITWCNAKKHSSPNDMSSIKKLKQFLTDNENVKLYYLVFPFDYYGPKNNTIKFQDNVKCGEYIKMKDFYYNPRTETIQAHYDVEQVDRSCKDFLNLIENYSRTDKFEKVA